MLILNLKNYESLTGVNISATVNVVNEAVRLYGNHFAVVPPVVSLQEVMSLDPLFEVVAPHADGIDGEKTTGSVTPTSLKSLGIHKTMLNHSEHKLDFGQLSLTINKCEQSDIEIILCINNLNDLESYTKLGKIHSVAYEPEELIGGDKSVATEQPEIVMAFIEKLRKLAPESNAVIGAGVRDVVDIKLSLEYGATSVLLASGFALAENKLDYLSDLVKPFLER